MVSAMPVDVASIVVPDEPALSPSVPPLVVVPVAVPLMLPVIEVVANEVPRVESVVVLFWPVASPFVPEMLSPTNGPSHHPGQAQKRTRKRQIGARDVRGAIEVLERGSTMPPAPDCRY